MASVVTLMRRTWRATVRVIGAAAVGARSLTTSVIWVVLVATAVTGPLLLTLYVLPSLWVGPIGKDLSRVDRLKAINDVRSTLVAALGGGLVFTGALIGAFFTARTIHVNREGQITDRFTRAIDQLGNKNLDVRLGGIYALERIAQESSTDHGSIMEVLTAYLREHAHWEPQEVRSPEVMPLRLRADFQAIATVLGRRPGERREREDRPLDLREVDLRAVDLADAHLERANLAGIHLEGADLRGAHLEEADLGDAYLKGAILQHAHLDEGYLEGAHLEGAYLGYAWLRGAILANAYLDSANLYAAHLEDARLWGACLRGAELRTAHLDRAGFEGAHLEQADLRHTDVGTVQGLTRAQLETAITDDTTMWPTSLSAEPA
jgi:uncharacterized protein YjbI with pentapeptide repeats